MDIRKSIVLVVSVVIAISLAGCSADKISGAENYDKNHYVETYKGDLDSNLSVFPDTLDNAKVNVFESSMSVGLFDTDGYIVLDCNYEQKPFESEIERLKGLSMTVEHYDGQKYTNNILYDEESYNYPAYVTIDGFGNTHEYALIDEADSRIVYVYTAYINTENFKYRDYLKKNLNQYDKDLTDSFSMYNHSFDGGNSWDEFDDSASPSDAKK